MKKSFSILLLLSFLSSGFNYRAQSGDPVIVEKEPKKVRFGLKGFSSIGWLTPENELSLTRGKIGIGFGWGLNTELYINNTTSFRTGFSLSTYNAGIIYNDVDKIEMDGFQNTYYVVDNAEFQQWEDTIPEGRMYKLNSRKYKLSYVNIPLILKLKTKEIGYMTYFGEFGGIIGLKTKANVEDTHIKVVPNTSSNGELLFPTDGPETKPTNDFNFNDVSQPVRAGLCLGAGAEYNFSGSTAIFFQLNWNYFMTSMLKKQEKDDYLRSYDIDNKSFQSVNSKSVPGSFHLTVGILF